MKKEIVECKLHCDYSGRTADWMEKQADRMSVTLRFTNNCSYRCRYCTFYRVGEAFAPLENFVSICDTLLRTQRGSYEFYIHGGEPSLHPQFHQIVSHIQRAFAAKSFMLVQTNLYKTADFYLHVPPAVKYLVSYHPAKTEPDIFAPKLRKLYDAGLLECVDFMLEENERSRIHDEFLRLKANDYGHLIRPRIIGENPLPEYRDLLQKFRPQDRQFQLTYRGGETGIVPASYVKTQNFRLMKCEAKNKKVVVNPDGFYWSCQAHMLSHLPMGNLLHNPAKFLRDVQTPMTCAWSTCVCELDLKKWREKEKEKETPVKKEAAYFCSIPFEYMALNPNMDVYLCCEDWLPQPIGNASRQPVKEIWNSPAAAAVRTSILDGSFRFCTNCPFLEEKGGPLRQVHEITGPGLPAIIKNRTTILERGPVRVNLAHDDSCDLKCPTCRTEPVRSNTRDHIRDEIDRHTQEKVMRQLKQDMRQLLVSGRGDPFASGLYLELLAGMKKKNYPHLSLYLHSNGQLFHRKNWHKIRGIHQAVKGVQISIDAADPETYKLNGGGSWERLNENLEFIAQLRREGPIESFYIKMTVQRNNWRQMPAFIDLGRKYRADAVVFMPLYDKGILQYEEYYRRAVHLESHPEHRQMARLLAHVSPPHDIRVHWGFFAKLLKGNVKEHEEKINYPI